MIFWFSCSRIEENNLEFSINEGFSIGKMNFSFLTFSQKEVNS
jgi:hypothetical protein